MLSGKDTHRIERGEKRVPECGRETERKEPSQGENEEERETERTCGLRLRNNAFA
jgi:hypothetical protein